MGRGAGCGAKCAEEMSNGHAGDRRQIRQSDVAREIGGDVFLNPLERNRSQWIHALRTGQRSRVPGGRVRVPAQKMMNQQVLGLRDEESVSPLLACGKKLELADEHLKETL